MCSVGWMMASLAMFIGPPRGTAANRAAPEAGLDFSVLRAIPVQSRGRVVPLDTVARRAVGEVTGRSSYAERSAVEVVLSWTLLPGEWTDLPVVKVEHEPLKKACGLDLDRRHFSLVELAACKPLQRLLKAADHAETTGGKPDALQRQALEIASRISTMQSFLFGRGLAFVPSTTVDSSWMTIVATKNVPEAAGIRTAWATLRAAYLSHDADAFRVASNELAGALRSAGGPNYPRARAVILELAYNAFHPFRWAWATMALAMVCGLTGVYLRRHVWDALTAALMGAGCVLFLAGFAMRWALAERAPLSNMYESMVAFAGSVAIFGLLFFLGARQRFVAVVAAGLSASGLILADVLPIDSTITMLPPVLRNTVWLTIHVATIILGYGAAALSMGVAHVQLGLMTLGPKRVAQAHEAARLNYYVILVAIVFLTAGIVFGAIWANASWGRYWGWDPKETWSLITLFGYLGLLHARYTGWLCDFGMAVASIACFQLVLMTYYGVNYILGTGLHSYGFGAGGLQWLLIYLGIEALVVGAAMLRHRKASIAPTQPIERLRLAATPTAQSV